MNGSKKPKQNDVFGFGFLYRIKRSVSVLYKAFPFIKGEASGRSIPAYQINTDYGRCEPPADSFIETPFGGISKNGKRLTLSAAKPLAALPPARRGAFRKRESGVF
ncbi:MAG: hypothetical protein IJC48_05310 [Clostridia bacterium]|nr:hypothetical protein [Clostridia bacterium]